MVNKQKRQNYDAVMKWSGWGASICLILFFINIIAGKVMHLNQISVNSPIYGPAEFILMIFIIIQFTVCVLLKEAKRTACEKPETTEESG